MEIEILRLAHRNIRDKRMSTHIGLTARAMGANKLVYTGDHDTHIERSIEKIVNDWGGNFEIMHIENSKTYVKKWKKEGGIVIHLTMFGIELSEKIEELKKKEEKILIVVGGKKVPGEMYHLADYNIAIGHQPHSEVAALAVFLDRITEGKARKVKYANAVVEITPQEKGKKAIRRE